MNRFDLCLTPLYVPLFSPFLFFPFVSLFKCMCTLFVLVSTRNCERACRIVNAIYELVSLTSLCITLQRQNLMMQSLLHTLLKIDITIQVHVPLKLSIPVSHFL